MSGNCLVLKDLELVNYRNYRNARFGFNPNLTIIYGRNAAGKTNLLEAVRVLSTGSSHRNSPDRELINLDEEEAKIFAELDSGDKQYQAELRISKINRKSLALNKVKQRKHFEEHGFFPSVIFTPDDLKIVKEGPENRRSFIDGVVSQYDRTYNYHKNRYQKILAQRNSLLKTASERESCLDTLNLWDEHLAESGAVILSKRFEFVKELTVLFKESIDKIDANSVFDIGYLPSPSFDSPNTFLLKDVFLYELRGSRVNDMNRGATGVGPHRDDVLILIDGRDSRSFASQGQQREITLALKIAEYALLREKIGKPPILLLDDVMSELDSTRRAQVYRFLANNAQSVITTTDLFDIEESMLEGATIIEIENGVSRVED
ncbi:MAG: DNA replication/repair protein RecF [Actinobacteria bacterium]|nr:DNA replication/repair protein RecF [Actinomycetota bacterium]